MRAGLEKERAADRAPFGRRKLTLLLAAEGGREVDGQAAAFADEAEGEDRGVGRGEQASQLGTHEGRAVDRLNDVADAEAARGGRALGEHGDDEHPALRAELRGAARRHAEGVEAVELQTRRRGETFELRGQREPWELEVEPWGRVDLLPRELQLLAESRVPLLGRDDRGRDARQLGG